MKHFKIKYCYLFIAILSFYACGKKEISVDLLIRNGMVYNGIDTIASNVSIGIQNDKIVFIGSEDTVDIVSTQNIDAKGMVVSPGFIDPHTHADRDLVKKDKAHNLPFLMQGVTTVVVGNDGESFYPISKYNDLYEKQGIGTNVIQLVGHGTLRNQVMGKGDKKATLADIEQMKTLLKQEMESGAFGISTGLFYAPGSYSNTEEVVALTKLVGEYRGIYDTHLRDESSYTIGLIPAIEEAIEIGAKAQVPIHISHIKCLGVDVWSKSKEIIRMVQKARMSGIEITANQYPYDASATGLKSAVVPRWAESGGLDSLFLRYNNPTHRKKILEETRKNIKRRGGANKLLIVKTDDQKFVNKNLLQISKELQMLPEETVFEILKTGYARVASFNMNHRDITNFMKEPWVVTGSDGNTGHPRKYGSFPRKYHKYVKQDKIISLSQFINNSTSKTASIVKLSGRGTIKKGFYADIIIFDPETFKDIADYANAFQYAEGLKYSIVNGKIAVKQGMYIQGLHGKVLKKHKINP
ncbi:N-acyl-D-amino-acid deacylase family protein [Aquimarina megaterium]|uniref:N-acyl-D-amino-acid deacylase family protein n=1 Tax=Aquimarina megaterium TaxID=1443666 RepID=UPI0004717C6F|nr:amidohydrolase family protein [Aquimarina megaterium]